MSMVEKLAYIKKRRHMTNEEIALRSGVPLGTLNKIFSGQTRNPAVGPVEKVAQVLHVPIQYLLDDDLPPECDLSACTQEGSILLLSAEEVRLLMRFRGLDERCKRSVETMTGLLAEPLGAPLGGRSMKRLICCVAIGPDRTGAGGEGFFLRSVLISGQDPAAGEADFAVLLTDGSMEPLYPAGSLLFCRKQAAPPQGYELFLFDRQLLVRRLSRRKGITKLVSPNLDFKDIVVGPADTLEPMGAVIGSTRSFRWE